MTIATITIDLDRPAFTEGGHAELGQVLAQLGHRIINNPGREFTLTPVLDYQGRVVGKLVITTDHNHATPEGI